MKSESDGLESLEKSERNMNTERVSQRLIAVAAIVIIALAVTGANHWVNSQKGITETAPATAPDPAPAPVAQDPAPAPAPVATPVQDAATQASTSDKASEATTPAPPPAAWTSPDRAAPIESDAVLDEYFGSHLRAIDGAVYYARQNDYRCDSVSSAHQNVFTHGFTLVCDHYSHSYTLWDRGGHTVVDVD